MGEFELIDAIVAELGEASAGAAVLVGPGDDAAIVAVPMGHDLVTSVDTLVADLHFPALADPQLIAQRALRVSLSDLAAMGAEPLAAVVALVLPKTTEPDWVRQLSQGFGLAAEQLQCPITGGNLTAGPLSISVTVQGSVPHGVALLRSGARRGDDVWVSGPLGGAAVALAREPREGLVELTHLQATSGRFDAASRAYFLPTPQLALGVALRGLANSAIDVSDGLAADLGHIVRKSGVAVELSSALIPRLAGASLTQALHGGDDYHLCFTAPAERAPAIALCAPTATVIGQVVAASDSTDKGAPALLLDGVPLAARGFDHFNPAGGPTDE